MKVAVVVLTLNEEERIEDCLKQFDSRVDLIFVLDGNSTDRTAELASRWADEIQFKDPDPDCIGIGCDKNYAWDQIDREYGWILWSDVDEIWAKDFLKNIREIAEEGQGKNILCFKFPRVTLPMPDPYDTWPDYQIKFCRNARHIGRNFDLTWKGVEHEVLWHKKLDMPADQINGHSAFGVGTLNFYPILHLPRLKKQRTWWKE